jgi:hypothetical protein
MLRYHLGRVPKKFFSGKYRRLPKKGMFVVRRKLEQDTLKIKECGIELVGDAKKLYEGTLNAQGKSGPKAVNVRNTKLQKYQLTQRRKKLMEEISEFEKYARQYFTSFIPSDARKTRSENPLERIIHKTYRTIEEFDSYIKHLGEFLEIVEVQQRKRR